MQGRGSGSVNLTAHAAIYPLALCTAVLRGIAAQHAREGRSVPRRAGGRLGRGVAVFDLMAEGGRL
eukprot:10156025-Alexandrium_andersonii.AAC.1